jgi:hypothetical protein
MTTSQDPNEPGVDGEPDAREREDRTAAIAIVAVLVVAAIVAVAWWLLEEDDEVVTQASTTTVSTTSTSAPTTEATDSTTSSTPDTPTGLTDEERAVVMWPYADTSRRYDDPVAAVQGFATELLGFEEPILGELAEGDARSGEVEVRAVDDGAVTTVLVRQFGSDDSWWVIGAETADIEVTQPAVGSEVANPLQVGGRSRAFEATVEVRVHEDGSTEPILTDIVMGGATEELEPFSGSFELPATTASHGVVVFRTTSAENGQVWQATVVRVAFAGG